MKYFLRLLMLALLLQSFQCDNNDRKNNITQEQLNRKKQEILQYISSFSCSGSTQCNSIAFGAKPCGGPREYLVFSNNIDLPTLENMVNEYYIMDNAYNIQTGAVSDCLLVSPPTNIGCENGSCKILN